MSNRGVLRNLKDGGCSICYASEENVGKKKCKHVNGGNSDVVVQNTSGFKVLDCTQMIDDEKVSMKERKSFISNYFDSIQDLLPPEQKQELLVALR